MKILRRSRKAEGIGTQVVGWGVCGPSVCKLIAPTIDSNLLHPPGCACHTVACTGGLMLQSMAFCSVAESLEENALSNAIPSDVTVPLIFC